MNHCSNTAMSQDKSTLLHQRQTSLLHSLRAHVSDHLACDGQVSSLTARTAEVFSRERKHEHAQVFQMYSEVAHHNARLQTALDCCLVRVMAHALETAHCKLER